MSTPPEPTPLRATIEYSPGGSLFVAFARQGQRDLTGPGLVSYKLGRYLTVGLRAGSYEPGDVMVDYYSGLEPSQAYLVHNLIGPLLATFVESSELVVQNVDLNPEESAAVRQAWIAIAHILGHI